MKMKQRYVTALAVIMGSILVFSGTGIEYAYADHDDKMIQKMIKIDNRLSNLQEMDEKFEEISLGNVSFEIKQINKSLLEINQENDEYDDRVNNAYDYLKSKYIKVIKQYQDSVKKYQKDNGLTEGERKLVTKVMKSKIVFSAEESAENLKKQEVKHIEKTIKESKAKKDFQKLITKIGQKLANDGQGNKIEKTAHKLAIKEIISSKNWEMSIPSIDRILTQTHDEESRQKLVDIKDKIHTVLEKKEKQSKQDTTYALKSQNSVLESNFQFEKNVIGFGGVLGQIYEDELVSSLEDTEEIIKVLDSKESLENQIIEDNTISTINTILEDEIIESLEEVDNITEEEETKIKDTREQQRKNAEENKSDNKSTKAKSVLKSLGNPDKGNSGNGNSGNGNGKNK